MVLAVGVGQIVRGRGGDPVLQLDVLRLAGVAPGVATVVLVMACYAGFLLSVTLHLQGGLSVSRVHAGAIFAMYASGFATASLSWPRVGSSSFRERLPVLGPPAMVSALLGIGLLAATCLALAAVLWAGTGCALIAVRGPRGVAATRLAA